MTRSQSPLLDLIKSLPDDTLITATFVNEVQDIMTITGQLCRTEWDETFLQYKTMYDDGLNDSTLQFDLTTRHDVNTFLTNIEVHDPKSPPVVIKMSRDAIEETIGRSVSDLAWHNLKQVLEKDPLGLFENLLVGCLEGVEEVITDDDDPLDLFEVVRPSIDFRRPLGGNY